MDNKNRKEGREHGGILLTGAKGNGLIGLNVYFNFKSYYVSQNSMRRHSFRQIATKCHQVTLIVMFPTIWKAFGEFATVNTGL